MIIGEDDMWDRQTDTMIEELLKQKHGDSILWEACGLIIHNVYGYQFENMPKHVN